MGTDPLHPPPRPTTSPPLFTVKFFQFLRYFEEVLPLHPLHRLHFSPQHLHLPLHLPFPHWDTHHRAAVNRRDGFIFEVVCFTSSPKTTLFY